MERLGSRGVQEVVIPTPQTRPGRREMQWGGREEEEEDKPEVGRKPTWRERREQMKQRVREQNGGRQRPPVRHAVPTDPPRNETPFYSTVQPAYAAAVRRKQLQIG